MRVLLCSPYLQHPGIVSGGINIWANIILKYLNLVDTDIEIIPVSFDRKTFIAGEANMFRRIYLGMKEYRTAIKEAKKMLDSQKIDVIHICSSASISLAKDIVLLNIAKKYGVKSVIHFHFGRIPRLLENDNWENRLLHKVISLASTVLTMDRKSFEVLCLEGNKNVAYCPNPLSLDIINQINKEKELVKRIPNKVLFVGHVVPSKGVFELVNACCQIADINLHIIGKVEDSIKAKLEYLARTKTTDDWIFFHGEIPHDAVIREMLSASVFVLPSYTEGFPNVILEAMACGTPIVATSVGAIPEMLDIASENSCGICVTPKDSIALRDAITLFMLDKGIALNTTERSVNRVYDLYSMPKVWDQLVKIWSN